MRPRVLIVDDHAAFRESASALLEAEGFEVVGEAGDGEEAMTAVERLRLMLCCSTYSSAAPTASRLPTDWPPRAASLPSS